MVFEQYKIGFIGGGNMATALIGGLLHAGLEPASILVAEPDAQRRDLLQSKYGIATTDNNRDVADRCATCVLAVKPQVMADVLIPIADILRKRTPLLVSIAAGITIASLDSWSGRGCAIVRAMPNTPALTGCGATALVANHTASDAQRASAESILSAVGITTWLTDESLMDVVTALSGSGPAYFFLVMDALCKAAEHHGLDATTARELCTQTMLGAATLARSSDESLERLRLNVTSPGGTTEQGVMALQSGGVEQTLKAAIDAARNRSLELAKQLGAEQ